MEADVGVRVQNDPFGHDESAVDLRSVREIEARAGKRHLTALRLQYKRLISTSSGALQTERAFLIANSRGDRVMSAREPKRKVTVARDRPMMVRYWKCHPYESFLVFLC